jgi:hypothetical protein
VAAIPVAEAAEAAASRSLAQLAANDPVSMIQGNRHVFTFTHPGAAAMRTLVVLAAALVSGCACMDGGHHPHRACFNCYSAWPCFGYHSTCWQPWPAECVTCPSPFLAPVLSGDKGPPLEPAAVPDAVLPMPVPANEAAPAPANLGPAPSDNSWNGPSSRRRAAEAQPVSYETSERPYELGSLRWAPAYNR